MRKENISVQEIAKNFGLTIVGDHHGKIVGPGSLKKQASNLIYWLKHPKYIERIPMGFVIISNEHFDKIDAKATRTYLVTNRNPRLVFAEVLQKYFLELGLSLSPNQVAIHRKNEAIFISENVYISENVSIGDGTIIHPNVVIHNGTSIGQNCVIKANTTLGTEGLGYETNASGQLVKFPQLGGVQLGNDVEIGPSATVRRGALDDTIVGNSVKIGAFCNIGHNCEIGDNTILTCQCVTGGSSIIANDVMMGIQSIVRNGIVVGEKSVLGAGAVVVKNVAAGETVIGSPAVPIGKFKIWSKIKKQLLQKGLDEE